VKYNNKGTSLQDLVEGFLFSLQAEGRSPQTHAYYSKLLGCLLKYSTSQSWTEHVDKLEVRQFREFLSWIASRSFEYTAGNNCRRFAQPQPSKAWRYYKAIRRLFNWSVEEGLLEKSPVNGLRFKAPPPPPIQPYNLDELKRLLAICELDIKTRARFCGLRNKGMILLFLDSGLRSSELTLLLKIFTEESAKDAIQRNQKLLLDKDGNQRTENEVISELQLQVHFRLLEQYEIEIKDKNSGYKIQAP